MAAFAKSFDELIGTLDAKAAELGAGRLTRTCTAISSSSTTCPASSPSASSRPSTRRPNDGFSLAVSGGDTARRLLRAPGRRRRHPDRLVEGRRLLGRRALRPARHARLQLPPRAARRCSSGSARSTPTTRCSARRAPTRTSCGSASSASSTSSTSAWAPTATWPRCSPAPPALDADPGRLVVMNEDPSRAQPAPPDDAHPRRASPGPGSCSSPSPARRSARRSPVCRAGDPTCPGAHVRADQVVWIADPAAAGDLTRRPRVRAARQRVRVNVAWTVSGSSSSRDQGATSQR